MSDECDLWLLEDLYTKISAEIIMCTNSLLSACTITLFTFAWLARIVFVKLENVFKLSLLNLVLKDLLKFYLC